MRRNFLARPRKKILITAGPTREMLDPVRFLSNLSTGEMGYAIAKAAQKRNYRVSLVSGPTALKPPPGVRFYSIESVAQLKKTTEKLFRQTDILVMSAAVSDFTAKFQARDKIKRTSVKTLQLKATPDIVAGLAKKKGKRLVIGFCLETSDWIQKAREKRARKNLDGIVANFLHPKRHIPFGDRKISVALISADGKEHRLTQKSKPYLAGKILDWIEQQKEFQLNRKHI